MLYMSPTNDKVTQCMWGMIMLMIKRRGSGETVSRIVHNG